MYILSYCSYTQLVHVLHNISEVCRVNVTIFSQEDEAELAKKVAALRWHGKELEVS